MKRQTLQIIRWACICITFACVIASWTLPDDSGLDKMLFAALIVFGFPGAMITLHLVELKHRERK